MGLCVREIPKSHREIQKLCLCRCFSFVLFFLCFDFFYCCCFFVFIFRSFWHQRIYEISTLDGFCDGRAGRGGIGYSSSWISKYRYICNVLKTIMMGYFSYNFLETLNWPFAIIVSTLSNPVQSCNEFIGQGVECWQFHPHQLSRERKPATCNTQQIHFSFANPHASGGEPV